MGLTSKYFPDLAPEVERPEQDSDTELDSTVLPNAVLSNADPLTRKYFPQAFEVGQPFMQRDPLTSKYFPDVRPKDIEANTTEFTSRYFPTVNPTAHDKLRAEVRQLEEVAEETGVLHKVKEVGSTVLHEIIDKLSRTNYAVAGAVDEFGKLGPAAIAGGMAPSPELIGNIMKRMGREIFSGLGDIQGDKEDFAKVFEDLGMPELGSLSHSKLLSGLYNKTGAGLKFKAGGFFDPTGRGTLGFVGNVVLDPLTYVTLGASAGRKLAIKGSAETFGKTALYKTLNKAGTTELTNQIKTALKLSDDGVEAFGRRLFSNLPNTNGELLLEKSDPFVKTKYRELKNLAHNAPIPEKIPIKDIAPEEFAELTRAATRVAEDDMARAYLDGEAGQWFDDGGVKFFGRTVPGTDVLQRNLSRLSADTIQDISRKLGASNSDILRSVLATSRWTAAKYNAIGRLFGRKSDPVWRATSRELLNQEAQFRALLELENKNAIGKYVIKAPDSDTVTSAIDHVIRGSNADHLARAASADDLFNIKRDANTIGANDSTKATNGIVDDTTRVLSDLQKQHPAVKSLKTKLTDDDLRKIVHHVVQTSTTFDDEELKLAREVLEDQAGMTAADFDNLEKATAEYFFGKVDAIKKATPGIDPKIAANSVLADIPVAKAVNEIMTGLLPSKLFFLSAAGKTTPELARKLGPAQDAILRSYLHEFIQRKYVSNLPIFFTNRSANITHGLRALSQLDNLPIPTGRKLVFDEDKLLGKQRSFYSNVSRKELLESASNMQRFDPKFPILKPVTDLRQIMKLRIDQHVSHVYEHHWDEALKNFDIDIMPALTRDIFRDLTQGDKILDDAKLSGIKDKLDKKFAYWRTIRDQSNDAIKKNLKEIEIKDSTGRVLGKRNVLQPPDFDKALKNLGLQGEAALEAKKWFIARDLLEVRTRRELGNFMQRYVDIFVKNPELMPRFSSLGNYLNADFTAFHKYKLKTTGEMIDLPAHIFDDLANSTTKKLLNSRDFDAALKPIDAATNFFKTMVTAFPLFPAFHARNFYGNVAQAFSDIHFHFLNPALHTRTVQILAGLPGTLRTKVGTVFTYDEIRDLAAKNNILSEGRTLYELTGYYTPYTANRLKRTFNSLSTNIRKPGTAIENEAKMAYFVDQLRRGLGPAEAAERVNKFLFDYSNLSGFEKQFMRRIIPFYTFISRNVPLQVENLFKRPGTTSVQAKALRMRDEDRQALSSWDIEGSTIRLDRDGKTMTVLNGVDLPFAQLNYFDALAGGENARRRRRELFSMLNPVIKIMGELATDTKIFTGKKFGRAENSAVGKLIDNLNVPQGVRNWIGYSKTIDPYTGKPRYEFNEKLFYILFDSWALSRTLRTTDKIFDDTIKNADPNLLQWWLTATKTETVNLDEEDYKLLKRRRALIQRELVQRGVLREVPITTPAGPSEY